jgi:hypothetical protein
VIVVSEERGSISFCFNGNIVPNLDGPRLRAALDAVFAPKRKERRSSRLGRWFGGRPTETLTERPETPAPSSVLEVPVPSSSIDRAPEVKPEEVRKETPAVAKPVPLRRASSADSEEIVAKRVPENEGNDDDTRPTVTAVKPVRTDGPQPAPLRKNLETKKSTDSTDARSEETKVDVGAPVTRRTGGAEPVEPARPMPRADDPARSEIGSSDGDRPSTESIST